MDATAAAAPTTTAGTRVTSAIAMPPPWRDPGFFPRELTINERADNYISQYDTDGDGAIAVGDFYDETTKVDTMWIEAIRPLGGEMNTTYSIERMARVADLMGDGDGKATAWEIADLMRIYDRGSDEPWFHELGGTPDMYSKWYRDSPTAHDDILQGNELSDFLEDFGPEVSTTNSWNIDDPIIDDSVTIPIEDFEPEHVMWLRDTYRGAALAFDEQPAARASTHQPS